MATSQNTYNEFAEQYASLITERPPVLYRELIVPKLLEFAGEVAGLEVLDAGCGEGIISRLFARLGAQVTAIDVADRLVEIARKRSGGETIEFHCLDLSEAPPEELRGKFDLVVSNMVIDDVPDYLGYIRSIAGMSKPRSRVVVTKNNPYSAVLRGKVTNYFDSGTATIYQGLASAGVEVYYYHRTLEEYVSAFAEEGYAVARLSDMKPGGALVEHEDLTERNRFRQHVHFPSLMAIEFVRSS